MNEIEFKVVRSGVRPHRVAILISDTSGYEEWLQVIDVCSQLWGGAYSVVVPTDGESISDPFWQLLDIYDPDIVVSWADLPVHERLRQEFPKTLNPFPTLVDGAELDVIWPDNTPYPLTKVTEVLSPGSGGWSSPDVRATPTVELLAYAHLGRFTAQTANDIQEGGVAVGYPDFDLDKYPQRTGDLWNLAWENRQAGTLDEWGTMPRDLSRIHLAAYSDPATPWYQAPVILVIGETAEDFCLFYSLSHMRPDVYWLPLTLANEVPTSGSVSWDDISASALSYLARQIDTRRFEQNRDGRALLVTSDSCDTDRIQDAMERLERARLVNRGDQPLSELYTVENNVRELLQFRHAAWELNNALGTVSHSIPVVSGEAADYLDVRPKHLTWDFQRQPVWVSEVAVDRYHLPRRAVFNSQAVSFDGLVPDTRITSTGIAFNGVKQMVWAGTDLDVALARPKLKTVSPYRVIGLLAEAAGYEIEISDKGVYQDGAVGKLGGVEEFVREFRSERWNILKKFLDESANQPGSRDQGMNIRGRRYLDATAIAALLECDLEDSALHDVVDDYLRKGVLQRGFALKCGTCRQMDWYPIGEVREQFRCSRCGVQQHFSPEARWWYRLDELVYQCLRHHLDDHILSVSAISRWAQRGSFMSIPSFDVFRIGARAKPYAEIDLACTLDGQIAIGECKSNNSMSAKDKKQLEKYQVFASKIGADMIVVSTSKSEWNKAATTYFDSWRPQLTGAGIQLRILTAADLSIQT